MKKNQVNSTLIQEIELFYTQVSSLQTKILKESELTLAHYHILQYIKKAPLTLKDLTVLSNIEKSTLSRQVTNLVKKKWLLKEQTEDKRVSFIQLSEEGSHKLTRVEKQLDDTWQTLFTMWPEEEEQLLSILLGRMNRHLLGLNKNS